MYTRTLAFRLNGAGVTVSSLDPGWVQTDMGYDVASGVEKPDRTVEQAANDIYNLMTKNTESGYFWRFGKKRDW
jgi:NAD(P)-dependent dehydrogenase (short-subunit alcohol dehydrogenase family)